MEVQEFEDAGCNAYKMAFSQTPYFNEQNYRP